jgi:hypothetical protein
MLKEEAKENKQKKLIMSPMFYFGNLYKVSKEGRPFTIPMMMKHC